MPKQIDARLTRLERAVGPRRHPGLFILPAEVLRDAEELAALMRKYGLTLAIFLPEKEGASDETL